MNIIYNNVTLYQMHDYASKRLNLRKCSLLLESLIFTYIYVVVVENDTAITAENKNQLQILAERVYTEGKIFRHENEH